MPKTRLHSDWELLGVLDPTDREHLVVDVGAHHGWFFHCWLDWCPAGKVIAFEPYPPSYEKTKNLYGTDPRVTLVNAGVASHDGSLDLNVLNESTVSNSFLSPVRKTWDAIKYVTGDVTQVTVPSMSLDGYASKNGVAGIYLLKIDVQGYEMEVLRGAIELLKRTDHVFVEAGIQRLYENAPRFSDVFDFLTAHGFHLMAMRSWHRGNNVLMETDMLFRRDGLEPPVDESVVRNIERNG